MKATEPLRHLGRSLWLDNITRGLLIGGTLERYIRELSVARLTSNPGIFDHAIRDSGFYDEAIRRKTHSARRMPCVPEREPRMGAKHEPTSPYQPSHI